MLSNTTKERVQFRVSTIIHQDLQLMLAGIPTEIEAAPSSVHRKTRILDQGYKVIPIMTSAASYFSHRVWQ